MKNIKFSTTKRTFLRGMASISSFRTGRSLESYRSEINALTGWKNNPNERIGRCWANVGTHLHNAMNSFAEQNDLHQPTAFNGKIEYY